MFPFPRSTKKNGKPNIIPQLIMCISISRGRRADVKGCFIKTTDFSYCDSGMIPWLLVISLMSTSGLSLAEMVDARIREYPCSGEINRKVGDADAIMESLSARFKSGIQDHMDGLSVVYDEWRFNLRKSNTEPVVRLNVETRGDRELLEQKTRELLDLIQGEKA